MIKTIAIAFAVIVVVLGSESYEAEYEHHYEPIPYDFGYEVKDDHGSQFRKESGNGHGQVEGSYGYTDEKGVYREVHYVADKSGFRAEVKTNEPGTKNESPADVKLYSNAKYDDEYFGNSVNQGYENAEYRRNDESPINLKNKGEHGGHN